MYSLELDRQLVAFENQHSELQRWVESSSEFKRAKVIWVSHKLPGLARRILGQLAFIKSLQTARRRPRQPGTKEHSRIINAMTRDKKEVHSAVKQFNDVHDKLSPELLNALQQKLGVTMTRLDVPAMLNSSESDDYHRLSVIAGVDARTSPDFSMLSLEPIFLILDKLARIKEGIQV